MSSSPNMSSSVPFPLLSVSTPSVKKGSWTDEEDRTIMEAVKQIGTKWNVIVKLLPGRTDNAIKNRWNSTMRKLQRQQSQLKLEQPHLPDPGSVMDVKREHLPAHCQDISRRSTTMECSLGKRKRNISSHRGEKHKIVQLATQLVSLEEGSNARSELRNMLIEMLIQEKSAGSMPQPPPGLSSLVGGVSAADHCTPSGAASVAAALCRHTDVVHTSGAPEVGRKVAVDADLEDEISEDQLLHFFSGDEDGSDSSLSDLLDQHSEVAVTPSAATELCMPPIIETVDFGRAQQVSSPLAPLIGKENLLAAPSSLPSLTSPLPLALGQPWGQYNAAISPKGISLPC